MRIIPDGFVEGIRMETATVVNTGKGSNAAHPVAEQYVLFDELGRAVMKSNLQHGFTQCPDVVLFNPDITRRAKLVFTGLLKYARQKDYCWPSQSTLAEDLSMSVDTVQRGLKDLRTCQFRVDPETDQLIVESSCPDCAALQQAEPNPKKRHRIHCDQHQCGLVEWKQRGLNKTNLYRVVPLYASLEELEAQLEQAAQEANVSQAGEGVSGKPQQADSTSRTMQDQQAANCGTKHIESQKNIQGNKDSNSNGSADTSKEGGVSSSDACSHIEHGAIGSTETEVATHTTNPSNRNSNPSPSKKEMGAGAARAKAAETHTAEQHANLIRILAQAGIPYEQFEELDAQLAPDAEQQRPPITPDLKHTIGWFSQEFHDKQHLSSNLTRAARIFQFSQRVFGDSKEQFTEFLYTARGKAKKAVMYDRNGQGQPARMKYFFTCLEGDTGYKQPCPKCTKDCRAEQTDQAAIGYQWTCKGCGHQFTVDVAQGQSTNGTPSVGHSHD